jgi:pimeloyl-ACP methyl ester carboxylesterase
MARDIDLSVFTDDLVNHLLWENLSDVVLVGHSFGGNAITGAAEQVPELIARLVYLDALVPVSGHTPFDALPPEVVAERIQLANKASGGISVPPPPASAFGVTDPTDGAWLEARLTPHPLKTFMHAHKFRGDPGNGLPAEYILCSDPIYGPLESARNRARSLGWPVTEIATGHNAMVTAPEALVDILEAEPKR